MNRLQIITISGKAGSGKDYVADLIRDYLSDKAVYITHFADELKYICRNLYGWDGVKDVYGRDLLQRTGTEFVREKDNDYWARHTAEQIEIFSDKIDLAIIADARFPNEIKIMQERFEKVVTIHVIRDNLKMNTSLTKEQQSHISETSLDDYQFDFTIHNNGKTDFPKYMKNWIETTLIPYLDTANAK